MKITGSPEVINAVDNSTDPEKVYRLIQKVFTSLPDVDEIFLHHLVPGRSGATVFLALTHSFGTPDIPIVIKCGPYEMLSKEAGNYDMYVLRKLRTAPRLLPSRPISDGEMAIAYELAGWTKSSDHLVTYLDYFHQIEEPSDLVPTLIPILTDLESWWNSAEVSQNTFFHYYKIYSKKDFAQSLKKICQEKVFAHFLAADPLSLMDFWNSLKSSWPFTTTLTSVIHADLNSTNIVIDTENHRAALIDFASVQQDGHTLRDLTKMEREIRCRLMGLEKVDFEQHLIEQGHLEAFFFLQLVNLKTPKSHLLDGRKTAESHISNGQKSDASNKAFDALINVYQKAGFYFSGFYRNSIQFLAELYLSIFFQTLLVTMFPDEDYDGQKVAAINSCFRLRSYIQSILNVT